VSIPSTITSTTRKLSQQQVDILRSLKPGQRIRVVQLVRVGAKRWEAVADGAFREINYLATGVTTDRIPEDDIVVPVVHFAKDNGELSSIAVDENTAVNVIGHA
jgi:hypothetical protein